jgi:hypothetical protein
MSFIRVYLGNGSSSTTTWSNVSEHLQNIFKTGELDETSVVREFRTTAADGKQYQTQYYNLDAIISVGYRVNSLQAAQFRRWVTGILCFSQGRDEPRITSDFCWDVIAMVLWYGPAAGGCV